MPLADIDQVVDRGLVVDHVLLFEFHLGVVITRRLEIILQVVGAFGEQIVIHCVLFVNRDVAAEFAFGNLGANGVHDDGRPGFDAQGGHGGVLRVVEFHAVQRDFGLQAVGLQVKGADSIQRLAHARLGHRLPGMNDPPAELGGAENPVRIHLGIARPAQVC